MELNHLRYFYEVARLGGFTRAEQVLFVQQSAISKIVRRLEGQLGVPLFSRGRAGVRLTPVGERLYATCHTIFAEIERFSVEASSEVKIAGDLRIAAAGHVAARLLAPALSALRQQHPALIPRVITGPSHMLQREIEERRLELGLFFKIAPSRHLSRRAIADFPCQLVVKRGLARDRKTLETFIGSREVDDLTNRKFPTVDFLRGKGWDTRIVYSCNALEAHRDWVLAGLGVSILPRFLVEDELRAGKLEIVYPSYVYRATLELVHRKAIPLSPGAVAFETVLTARIKS